MSYVVEGQLSKILNVAFGSEVRDRRTRKLTFGAFRAERQVTCILLPDFGRTLKVRIAEHRPHVSGNGSVGNPRLTADRFHGPPYLGLFQGEGDLLTRKFPLPGIHLFVNHLQAFLDGIHDGRSIPDAERHEPASFGGHFLFDADIHVHQLIGSLG